jgi:hypothetical protein
MQHKVSGVDKEARLGVCTVCGIGVQVVRNGPDYWRCKLARRQSQQRTSKSRHHGLTWTEMEDMKARIGKCEICSFPTELRVDHSHQSGAIRGILCNFCNTSLYVVEKDKLWGFRALWYLWRKRESFRYRPGT